MLSRLILHKTPGSVSSACQLLLKMEGNAISEIPHDFPPILLGVPAADVLSAALGAAAEGAGLLGHDTAAGGAALAGHR